MYSLTKCENSDAWNAFLDNEKSNQVITIAHNPCLGKVLSNIFGYRYKNYFIQKDGVLVGVLPTVKIGTKIVSMPHFSYGGPVFKQGHEEKIALSSLLNDVPYEVRSFQKLSPFSNQKKISFVLPLHSGEKDIFAAYTSKMRNKIRKSGKLGYTIIVNGPNALDDFYFLYSKRMLQKGSPPLGKSFFKALLTEYQYGKAEITVAYDGDKPIATGFCLSYLNFKEVCWASTDPSYNRYNVNSFVFWDMIKKSIEEGFDYFSMGRSTVNSNNHTYKLQWNPLVMPLYFNVPKEGTASLRDLQFLTKIWKHQPLKTSQILGSYVSKFIY